MGYTPKNWGVNDPVIYADLNHIETQFDEAYDYFTAHNHDLRYYTKTAARVAFWYAGNDGSGSGSDADLIYKASGNLHAASFAGLGIAAGIIIWWEGALETIPSGWHICDGAAGTRDLRDRFIICAGTGSGYSVGDTGGSATFTASGTITINAHTLIESEIAAHNHPFTEWGPAPTGNIATGSTCGRGSTSTSGNTPAAGSGSGHGHSVGEGTTMNGNPVTSLPFCYALYAIQKL